MYALLDRISTKTLLSIIFIIYMIVACFSEGFHHPDEQYYAIDFALLKLGHLPTDYSTWELEAQIRPWLLPSLYIPIIYTFKTLFNIESPFIIADLLRIFSMLLSFSSIIFILSKFKKQFQKDEFFKLALCVCLLTWFIPYMSVRTSSDNITMAFFLIGMGLLFSFLESGKKIHIITSALFCALAFGVRHQTGVLIFFMYTWALLHKKILFKEWILFLCTPLFIFLCLITGIDSWGYGEFVITPIKYIQVNILQGKASSFGIEPPWYYFTKSFLKINPFVFLAILVSLLIQVLNFKKDLFGWLNIPFLLIHCLIGHKELRFIYPVAVLSLIYLALILPNLINKFKNARYFKILFNLTLFTNLFFLIFIMFKPAYTPIKAYRALWEKNIKTIVVLKDKRGRYPKLEMPFYKRSSLKVMNQESINMSKDSYILSVKFNDLEQIKNNKTCNIIYQTYGDTVLNVKLFGWRERSNIWALSHCKAF